MENRENYWEKIYRNSNKKVRTDIWLSCYLHLFNKTDKIIEFGCGAGYLSEYLLNKGFKVLSTDISSAALEILKKRVPGSEVMKINLVEPLPFKSSSVNIIIADLCLHYFSEEDTKSILEEYKRILKPGGHIFARVNSDRDINHGAGEGIEVERGYYNQNGHYKRFFNLEMVHRFFTGWEELSVSEKATNHYIKDKYLFEIIAGK